MTDLITAFPSKYRRRKRQTARPEGEAFAQVWRGTPRQTDSGSGRTSICRRRRWCQDTDRRDGRGSWRPAVTPAASPWPKLARARVIFGVFMCAGAMPCAVRQPDASPGRSIRRDDVPGRGGGICRRRRGGHWGPSYRRRHAVRFLEGDCYPSLGDVPIAGLETAHLLPILQAVADREARSSVAHPGPAPASLSGAKLWRFAIATRRGGHGSDRPALRGRSRQDADEASPAAGLETEPGSGRS